MTCNITNTPFVEPLPLYRRDPDTVSILSSAPSYHSDAPTYTSRRPSNSCPPVSLLNLGPNNRASNRHSVTIGLPNIRYAPGYESRAHGSSMDMLHHNYNVANWSNIHSANQSLQYQRVAARRVAAAGGLAAMSSPSNSNSFAPQPRFNPNGGGGGTRNRAPPSNRHSIAVNVIHEAHSPMVSASHLPLRSHESPELSSTMSHTTSRNNTTTQTATSPPPLVNPLPLNPGEDPALVGEYAANRAREQRLYREMCFRGDAMALRADGKAWDFMTGQMTDWEQRTDSWRKFRSEVKAVRNMGMGGAVGKIRNGLGIARWRKSFKRARFLA